MEEPTGTIGMVGQVPLGRGSELVDGRRGLSGTAGRQRRLFDRRDGAAVAVEPVVGPRRVRERQNERSDEDHGAGEPPAPSPFENCAMDTHSVFIVSASPTLVKERSAILRA